MSYISCYCGADKSVDMKELSTCSLGSLSRQVTTYADNLLVIQYMDIENKFKTIKSL